MKNGKVREFTIDGKLLFDGEYLNDTKLNVKVYDGDGYDVYEIKNGKGFLKE